jgi:hypothetical protein
VVALLPTQCGKAARFILANLLRRVTVALRSKAPPAMRPIPAIRNRTRLNPVNASAVGDWVSAAVVAGLPVVPVPVVPPPVVPLPVVPPVPLTDAPAVPPPPDVPPVPPVPPEVPVGVVSITLVVIVVEQLIMLPPPLTELLH